MSSTAGFLVIGNEILSGKVVDTNSPFLAKELRAHGVDLERILTISDDVETIAREVRALSDAYDWVFTSGGIGPTHDDVTMEGVALGFGCALELDPALCDRIEKVARGAMNDSMRKMAMVPSGATVHDTEDLWFPLLRMENVFILPGIPELFQKKFEGIRPLLKGVPFQLRRVFVTSYESEIAEHLNDLLVEFSDLMLGSYPRLGEEEYRVMVTLESRDSAYLQRALDSLIGRLPRESIHRIE
jgi:FAD synthetase